MPSLIAPCFVIISVAWIVIRPVIVLPIGPVIVASVSIIGPVIVPVRVIAVPDIDGNVDTGVRFLWPGEKQGQNERTGESNATQLH